MRAGMGSGRNRKAKLLQNGRNEHETNRFARLPHSLLQSAAYRSLSPNARSLLMELISMETGKNNGKMWLSEADAARRMGVSCPKVAHKAFAELMAAGFIAITKDRHWHIKTGTGRARSWRLTWLFNCAERKSATDDWRKFEHPDKASWRRMDNGLRALSAYRKELSENRIWQGDLPDTSIARPKSDTLKQGDMPHTPSHDNAFPPFYPKSEQGDMPEYIAVPSVRSIQ